jgi:hypothetical protein
MDYLSSPDELIELLVLEYLRDNSISAIGVAIGWYDPSLSSAKVTLDVLHDRIPGLEKFQIMFDGKQVTVMVDQILRYRLLQCAQ